MRGNVAARVARAVAQSARASPHPPHAFSEASSATEPRPIALCLRFTATRSACSVPQQRRLLSRRQPAATPAHPAHDAFAPKRLLLRE